MHKKNIVIQGLGFVGSAMAVTVASKVNKDSEPLFNVIGIDLPTNEGLNRIDLINSKIFPFKTNDNKLSQELSKAVLQGNLIATCNKDIYKNADIVIVSINCDLDLHKSKEKIITALIKSIDRRYHFLI